jgi:hypothetical protein
VNPVTKRKERDRLVEEVLSLLSQGRVNDAAATIDELYEKHGNNLNAFIYAQHFAEPLAKEYHELGSWKHSCDNYEECPSSNKWNRFSGYLVESFVPRYHVTRRAVDSANDVSR